MTLDGRTATADGDSKWISGEAIPRARPSLARRSRRGRGRDRDRDRRRRSADRPRRRRPARSRRRVVFDSGARLPLDGDARATTTTEAPVIVIAGPNADPDRVDALTNAGVEVVVCPGDGADRVRAGARRARPSRDHAACCSRAGRRSPARSAEAGELDELRLFYRAAAARRRRREPAARRRRRTADSPRRSAPSPSTGSRSATTCSLASGCGSGEMFTGLIAEIGTVDSIERERRRRAPADRCRPRRRARSRRLGRRLRRLPDGDRPRSGGFAADVMNQTLDLTALGDLEPGLGVNLEPALRASDRLGGHIVQGHVDATGEVIGVTDGRLRPPRPGRASRRARALRDRARLDRPRRRQPHGRRARGAMRRGLADPGDARADDARRASSRGRGQRRGRPDRPLRRTTAASASR